MKKFFIICSLAVLTGFSPSAGSFYDFKVEDIDGKPFDLAGLKGKTVLIVNTASECGYTPQYKDLQELYLRYKDKNFTVIGFPANNFGGQEPGSNPNIKEFCTNNFSVIFPMMAKISVKGDDAHPLYKWLTSKTENGVSDAEVKWNFWKFLIGPDGKWLGSFPSKVKPTSADITSVIEKQQSTPGKKTN